MSGDVLGVEGRATAIPVHSSSLPFCVRFNEPVTRPAATLDTRPRAKGYAGGIPTRLSKSHFQFARDVPCWADSHSFQMGKVALSQLVEADTHVRPRIQVQLTTKVIQDSLRMHRDCLTLLRIVPRSDIGNQNVI